jgi:hypothetical protein
VGRLRHSTRRRRQPTPDLLLELRQLPIQLIGRYEACEHLIDVMPNSEMQIPEGVQELTGREARRATTGHGGD